MRRVVVAAGAPLASMELMRSEAIEEESKGVKIWAMMMAIMLLLG